MLADSISKWWDKNKNIWTRFIGTQRSSFKCWDELRQDLALQYLRFDNTICDGLTFENYKNEIKPLVRKN